MANLNERMVGLGTQRSVIRELFEYGKKRTAEVGAENVFDFSIGNPSVPSPDKVNETAIKLINETDPVIIHGYTSAQGDAGVRQMLADSVNSRFGVSVNADNFYVTVGAAAALCCTLNGICNPNDEVVVFAPYFPEYKVFIEGSGAKMVMIPADIDAFQIDFEKLNQSITNKTKAVLVNSPNNPCGVVYSEDTIKKLSELLNEKQKEYGHPIYIISDEPYREIVFDNTVVPYLPKYYDNTIICYSWSKSLSIPGERLGYVLVTDKVEEHALVYAAVAGAGRSLGYVNAPGLFQRVCAMCEGLTSDISVYETNRNLLYNGLKELGFSVVKPDGTFYIFPRSLEPDDIAFCERAKEFDILIVPGTGFGCPGHVRISYCVPTKRIERALYAFKKLADSYN